MPIDPKDIAICTSDVAGGSNPYGSIAPPILQTSLFTRPTFENLLEGLADEKGNCVYTRGQNPTVEYVERQLAALERGEVCKCFGSGMAAVSAIFLGLLKSGDHILFLNQVYGPTLELAKHLGRFGIECDVVMAREMDSIEKAIKQNTRLVWFESPSTMLFKVLDICRVTELAATRGVLTGMDNTWATPLLQKPMMFGVDIVMHSCSKYVGGHSDVVAGAVVTNHELMEQIFYGAFLLNGGVLAPFDAWLLARGVRTLPIRMERHQKNGLDVARFLDQHPAVHCVFHPAMTPGQHKVVDTQLTGYSGLFSFQLESGTFADVCRFLNRLKVFRLGVSWGGVESLAISPNRGDNAEHLAAQGIPAGLIRLSVGLEDVGTLVKDLEHALAG